MAAVVLLAACTQQAPQRPSQRTGQVPVVDSAALALLEFNQQMTAAADQQLAAMAQEQDRPYALYHSGAWMTILDKGDETLPCPVHGEEITVHMRVCRLDGQLLTESKAVYRLGKHELPPAADANIGELHPGGKARMLVPWYSAYGLQGTNTVAPYENVIIEIALKK